MRSTSKYGSSLGIHAPLHLNLFLFLIIYKLCKNANDINLPEKKT